MHFHIVHHTRGKCHASDDTHDNGHFGTLSMGKAAEPWCIWMIIGIGGETNGWALDTTQIVGA